MERHRSKVASARLQRFSLLFLRDHFVFHVGIFPGGCRFPDLGADRGESQALIFWLKRPVLVTLNEQCLHHSGGSSG